MNTEDAPLHDDADDDSISIELKPSEKDIEAKEGGDHKNEDGCPNSWVHGEFLFFLMREKKKKTFFES